MQLNQLREISKRLFDCDTLKDSVEMLNIINDYLLQVIMLHSKDPITDIAKSEAMLINQMIFSRMIHLGQTLQGIGYDSGPFRMNETIDPTIVGGLVRSVYEMVAMFNLVYVNPKTNEEREILYKLWVVAGLKFRQRFNVSLIHSENKEKSESELEKIDKLVTEIKSSPSYQALDSKSKLIVDKKIKEKDFKIQFINGSVRDLSWADAAEVMGFKKKIMGQIYTFLSLYSHPSNVSVFQFRSFYDPKDPEFVRMVNFQVQIAFFCVAAFIGDFIKVFPNVLNSFEKQHLVRQIAIDWKNVLARGHHYAINNCLSKLG